MGGKYLDSKNFLHLFLHGKCCMQTFNEKHMSQKKFSIVRKLDQLKRKNYSMCAFGMHTYISVEKNAQLIFFIFGQTDISQATYIVSHDSQETNTTHLNVFCFPSLFCTHNFQYSKFYSLEYHFRYYQQFRNLSFTFV